MVVVFVPHEAQGETRVSATPEVVKALSKAGAEVLVQRSAGVAAGFVDDAFVAVKATIVSREDGLAKADMMFGIASPSPDDVAKLKAGTVLVCGMQPLLELPVVKALAEHKVTTFAMDLMPRITRAQKMDILSSQATVAGYQAVLLAAVKLPRFFPLLMTAAGTVPPARVLILGAGVAGLQAIATARRLGAVVEANDIRPAVKEQVESLGAKFVDTGTPPQAESRTGYAKETTDEYLRKQRETLTQHIGASDVLITTALIPGRKAPVLVTKDMVKAMKPGSVIVDLAVEMGGNVEGSVKGQNVEIDGITIIGEANLPGLVPHDASRMFARNIQGFVELLLKDGKLEPNWEDECVTGTSVTRDGKVTHEGAAAALETTDKAPGGGS